jgi:hypothetical protein
MIRIVLVFAIVFNVVLSNYHVMGIQGKYPEPRVSDLLDLLCDFCDQADKNREASICSTGSECEEFFNLCLAYSNKCCYHNKCEIISVRSEMSRIKELFELMIKRNAQG